MEKIDNKFMTTANGEIREEWSDIDLVECAVMQAAKLAIKRRLAGKTLTDLLVPEFQKISLPVADMERLQDRYQCLLLDTAIQLHEHWEEFK